MYSVAIVIKQKGYPFQRSYYNYLTQNYKTIPMVALTEIFSAEIAHANNIPCLAHYFQKYATHTETVDSLGYIPSQK